MHYSAKRWAPGFYRRWYDADSNHHKFNDTRAHGR